jgi:hypothetical protein
MNGLSPLGWLAVAIIVILTFGVNYALVLLLRSRDQAKRSGSGQLKGLNRGLDTFSRLQEVMRDPFADERKQLNELSDLVSHLNEPHEPGDPTQETKKEA